MGARTDYVAVERSAGARKALRELAAENPRVRMVRILDDLPSEEPEPAGIVLANELLDNLPFHRLVGTANGPVELRVGLSGSGNEFALVESPAPQDLIDLAPRLSPEEEAVVSPRALEFLDRAARAIARGYLLFVDYAWLAGPPTASSAGAVHGYARHRVEADVLSKPGSRDITAGIDVGVLLDHARRGGLRVWGPVTQRDALTNLGIGAWDGALRERQARALNEGRGAEATRIYSARNAARLLTDPAGLGGFTVLCFGVGDVPRPALLLDGEAGVRGD
jgi:SAM-dependent MidA family methyltransferase